MWRLIVAEKSFLKKGKNNCRVVDRKKQKTSHVYHMGIARLVSLKSISYFWVTNTYNAVSSPSMIHHHKALKNKNYPFGRSSAW